MKYIVSEQLSWVYIGKLNKRWLSFSDKEEMSDNDIMQTIEILCNHIAKKRDTDSVTIKRDWRIVLEYKIVK